MIICSCSRRLLYGCVQWGRFARAQESWGCAIRWFRPQWSYGVCHTCHMSAAPSARQLVARLVAALCLVHKMSSHTVFVSRVFKLQAVSFSVKSISINPKFVCYGERVLDSREFGRWENCVCLFSSFNLILSETKGNQSEKKNYGVSFGFLRPKSINNGSINTQKQLEREIGNKISGW